MHLQRLVVTMTTRKEMFILPILEKEIQQSGATTTTATAKEQELKVIKNLKRLTYSEADLAVKKASN